MNRIAMVIALVALVVFVEVTVSEAEDPVTGDPQSVPTNVATTMSALLNLSQQQFVQTPGSTTKEYKAHLTTSHTAFLDLLKSLHGKVTDGISRRIVTSAKDGIEPNLIEMAKDYSKHPEHYERLIETYKHPGNLKPSPHVIRSRHPAAEHCVEQYRAAWEVLLLAPTTTDSRFMRRTCFEAVAKIHSDASIPLLLFLYERANAVVKGPAGSGHALEEQLNVIKTLNRYQNTTALQALLRCVEISESVPPPLPIESMFTMREWVMRHLRDQENVGNGKEWEKVIQTVLSEKLSEADRAFSNEVLRKGPKDQ